MKLVSIKTKLSIDPKNIRWRSTDVRRNRFFNCGSAFEFLAFIGLQDCEMHCAKLLSQIMLISNGGSEWRDNITVMGAEPDHWKHLNGQLDTPQKFTK